MRKPSHPLNLCPPLVNSPGLRVAGCTFQVLRRCFWRETSDGEFSEPRNSAENVAEHRTKNTAVEVIIFDIRANIEYSLSGLFSNDTGPELNQIDEIATSLRFSL